MNYRPAVSLFVAAAVGACAPQPRDRGWEHEDDRTRPSVSDTSECHSEARRRAEYRYPQPSYEQVGRTGLQYESERRFPAEMAFFGECMRRKGFVEAG